MTPSKTIIDKKNVQNDDYCRRLINDKVLVTRKEYIPVCKKASQNRTKYKCNVIWDYPATAITSYIADGRFTKSNYSRKVLQSSYNALLTSKLNSINPPKVIGDKNGKTVIGHCAEPHAANQTMNAYFQAKNKNLPLSDIYFSLAKRPRTLEIIPTCENCKLTFPNL